MIRFGICNELFEGWDLARACRTIESAGYDGIELAPFTLAPRIDELSPSDLRSIRQTISDHGLETIGLHWLLAKTEGLHLTHPDATIRRATEAYLVALGEATAELGGSLMVFGSPKQRSLLPGVTREQANGWAADAFDRVASRLEPINVQLCLEPLAPSETDFCNSIAEALALIERVDRPNLSLHLDVKAMSSDPGGSVPALIERHGSKAGHFHAQDPLTLRGPGMGDCDFGPIMRALSRSGYGGWVSVEVFDFSAGAELTARQSLRTLKAALA
jgi:sugar phosphate isomerase/epimerase